MLSRIGIYKGMNQTWCDTLQVCG